MNTQCLPLIPDRAPSPAMIAVAGLSVLALAMGIGRFAFTALLPLAKEQGLLTLSSAGWLAASNYGGYLVGALWVVRSRSAHAARRLGIGLMFSVVTTLERSIGRTLDLTYKEFELLRHLAANPGRVFTRAQLLQEVWGYDYFGGTRTVDVHVRRLRAKLGVEYDQLIGTVRNVGYRFNLSPAPLADTPEV